MTSLDDLLTYEEEPPPPPRKASPRRWVAMAVLLAAGGGLVLYGAFRLGGLAVPYPLIFAVLLTAQLLRRALRWVAWSPVPQTLRGPSTGLRRPGVDEQTEERDGLDLAVTRWDTRLAWLRPGDAGQFSRTVQPRLVAVIDERLRLRHGVTLEGDPARARSILGEHLWTFASRPVSTSPGPVELAALVTRVEEI